jgi:hypothetical protein
MVITEIVSRSSQGTTLPFICRAADGLLYFVKGQFAGRKSLCAEWIAGRLGILLGLPIPTIAIATVPEFLFRLSARSDVSELGTGPVFASQYVEDAQELTFVSARAIPENLRDLVFLFDWWVHNEDRTLSEFGGNPNLIWSDRAGGLQVFDHNLAFDEDFDAFRFSANHVFSRKAQSWPENFRDLTTLKMKTAISAFPKIWSELPKKWLYEDADSSLSPCLNYEEIHRLLNRFKSEPSDFWTLRK